MLQAKNIENRGPYNPQFTFFSSAMDLNYGILFHFEKWLALG